MSTRKAPPNFDSRWLAQALEAGKMGAWYWDLETGDVFFDETQCALTGIGEVGVPTTTDAFFDLVHPEDAEPLRQAVEGAMRRDTPYISEFRIIRPDGRELWLGARGEVVGGSDGSPTHFTGLNWDITEEKRREERQDLAAKEMAHRVKNVIALVNGIARMSARSHDTLETFLPAFIERTEAIGTVNDLVLQSETRRASLMNIVGDTLRTVSADGRVAVDVADFEVNAPAAQTLVLVLNELATNAVKHGALQTPDGRLALRISIDLDSDVFVLKWTETCPNPIVPNNDRKGFGSQVLLSLTRSTSSGEPKITWRPNGLEYTCRWKASEMAVHHGPDSA